MEEDVDRRIRLACVAIEIEPLDRRRAVAQALRRAEPRAHLLAVGAIALDDLCEVGGVFRLVVGVVELLLVEVEPHQRAFRRAGKNGPSI